MNLIASKKEIATRIAFLILEVFSSITLIIIFSDIYFNNMVMGIIGVWLMVIAFSFIFTSYIYLYVLKKRIRTFISINNADLISRDDYKVKLEKLESVYEDIFNYSKMLYISHYRYFRLYNRTLDRLNSESKVK